MAEAEAQLEASCEATRDLYLFMLGTVSPLTKIAADRIDAARRKFNPTEEEKNPNTKFADNALAKLLDADPDFVKLFRKKKFSWEQYDLVLKKIFNSIVTKDYYAAYMQSPESSLKDDCRLFIRIFEEEFVGSSELEAVLEGMSIYWGEDLPYALTYVCRTLDNLGKGGRWTLPPLYLSETRQGPDIEDDRLFARNLLRAGYLNYGKYYDMVAGSVSNWDNDRIVSTDMCIIILGMAEAVAFPTIPVKVTINEYVEISKFFGTPKSKIFVNGILDRLIQKMSQDGMIVKSGKGLL
ncbi:MAG: transcription antitermination protein NusB [Bacteroidetes bacterium]|uniref:Transcription antitermination protein NusB n=1 Tax=Candidatus Cryptobacteroides merdigallinarum TaxID=2840770 RepID=A0A9D9HFQ0_9BACT|nr:transcription antitermination protein NusB [Candidatus Cryptobacteroides merdigallinarum]